MTETAIHKEIDLIQDIVKRMATNSFQIKTWMMGILTAVLAFKNEEIFSAGKAPHHTGAWISLVLVLPVLMFWYLDAFFLRTEKRYREIYKWVVSNRPKTDEFLYDLNTMKRKNFTVSPSTDIDLGSNMESIVRVMVSKTLVWFYAIPLTLVVAVTVYNWLYK